MSESRIDKLKPAAVRSKSLGGRYDPAPHTESSGGCKDPTCFENMQGNLLLNEGDNQPLIFCVCWDVPPQSNSTFIDSNLMQISPQVCNSRGLLFTHFHLSICFEGADSSLHLFCHCLSQELSLLQPLLVTPPTRFYSPLPNIWHCCANSFQMPVHTGERNSSAQDQAFDSENPIYSSVLHPTRSQSGTC